MRGVSYIVYGPTGAIVRTGICPERMLGIQPGAGESVMKGQADDRIHRVEDDRKGGKRVAVRPDADISRLSLQQRLELARSLTVQGAGAVDSSPLQDGPQKG